MQGPQGTLGKLKNDECIEDGGFHPSRIGILSTLKLSNVDRADGSWPGRLIERLSALMITRQGRYIVTWEALKRRQGRWIVISMFWGCFLCSWGRRELFWLL